MSSAIQPRPYQVESLEAVDNHVRAKGTNPCVVIPTGGGKSILIAWSIQQWKLAYPKFRVCILAHRKELVSQNASEMASVWSDADIGIYSASLNRRDQDNSIVFASIDSVYKRWGEFPAFDCLIVDEAHRIPARGEGKYLEFIKGCRRVNPSLCVVGYTATAFRMNSGPICHRDHILNEICYEANVSDLIEEGFLCRLRSKVGDVQPNLTGVKKNSGGDYIVKSLADAVGSDNLVPMAIRSAMKHIEKEERKSVIFFCVDIEHCKSVSLELAKNGMVAPVVTGKTPQVERDRIASMFKAGQIRGICNVNVYTEGFNAKRVDCIVLLRPTLSKGLYVQMVGRGLRQHEDKSDCIVLDYALCIIEHGPIDCIDQGAVSLHRCGECGDVFSRALKECPHCGREVPVKIVQQAVETKERERRMHEAVPADHDILGGGVSILEVDDVTVSRHRKAGNPDSIRVQYRCGLSTFREWVCLDHVGYAQTKAKKWWGYRFGRESEYMTVNLALTDMMLADRIMGVTKSISTARRGKYVEIVGYEIIAAGKASVKKEVTQR